MTLAATKSMLALQPAPHTSSVRWLVPILVVVWLAGGCSAGDRPAQRAGDAATDVSTDAGADDPGNRLPYTQGVVDFEPGDGAGYGQDQLPDVVLGPPTSGGVSTPSLDVLTLGKGGEIIVSFGERTIVDGPGADLIIFENPFYVAGNPDQVYQELGSVAVSRDGERWKSFDCRPRHEADGAWPGCAGWRPTRDYDPTAVVPLDPAITGGDPFDLSDLGIQRVNYVRIRDRSTRSGNGFDLDAVGAVHLE